MFLPAGNLPLTVVARSVDNATAEDFVISTGRPTGIELSDLGLGGTAAFVDAVKSPALPILTSPGDRILVYENNGDDFNNAPNASYFYLNGHWRKVGSAFDVSQDDVLLLPGQGVVLRKNGGGSGTATWTNRAPY